MKANEPRFNRIDVYSDGVTVRLRNKRIVLSEVDNGFEIHFRTFDLEADKPSCYCLSHKGKIRDTVIGMSSEGIHALVRAYIIYEKEKRNESKPTEG